MLNRNALSINIRGLRKKMGLNQEALADLIGVSLTTLRRWEWGTRSPRMEEIKRIAVALHVTEDELLNGPREERWILKINLSTKLNREEFIDMTSNNCVSDINLTPNGASLTLGGGYYMFEDDSKFEDFISQIREARNLIIESGRKMLKIVKAAPAD